MKNKITEFPSPFNEDHFISQGNEYGYEYQRNVSVPF